jgi:cobalt-zinc-cadmium efflux system outer membrane protein
VVYRFLFQKGERVSRGGRVAAAATCLGVVALVGGCKLLDQAPRLVAEQLGERTGAPLGVPSPNAPRYPCPVPAEQTEDGAIALALANNAAFREVLCDLGIAHSDVIEAGVIPNPDLRMYAPVSPRPLEAYLEFPIDAFILRPKRVAIAELEAARVRETVIQAGLTLARDVRFAYADVLFAVDRQTIARDGQTLRQRIAGLAENRQKFGEATPIEIAAARTDAQRAAQEFGRTIEDLQMALERFQVLLGYTAAGPPLQPTESPLPLLPASVDDLIEEALRTRPDALAVAEAVASAEKKQKLARHDWLRIFGNYYTFSDLHVVQHRPGFRVTLPIFNWNQGKIARADADLAKAQAQQLTVHDRIVIEVKQAFLQCQQAQRDLDRWRTKIRPTVEDAVAKAELSFKLGDAPLVLVLETTRQVLETRLREAQLRADLRKAFAELERSVGHKVVVFAPPTLEFEAP